MSVAEIKGAVRNLGDPDPSAVSIDGLVHRWNTHGRKVSAPEASRGRSRRVGLSTGTVKNSGVIPNCGVLYSSAATQGEVYAHARDGRVRGRGREVWFPRCAHSGSKYRQ